MIHVSTLPPVEGFVEVEVSGVRLYKNAKTGALYKPDELPASAASSGDSDVWAELDKAYQEGYSEGYTEGVNTAYDK